MGKVIDREAMDAYRQVLLTLGSTTGYILWRNLPLLWLSRNLPNLTTKLIQELMIEHVAAGGEIDQVLERRPEYLCWRFHYDLRMPISNRRVYIETVFVHEPDPEDCQIWVVNMHDV
jgi:hypothetical protein